MEIAQHMDAFVTLVVTVGVLAGLVWNRWPAEWLMMAAAVSLILLGVNAFALTGLAMAMATLLLPVRLRPRPLYRHLLTAYLGHGGRLPLQSRSRESHLSWPLSRQGVRRGFLVPRRAGFRFINRNGAGIRHRSDSAACQPQVKFIAGLEGMRTTRTSSLLAYRQYQFLRRGSTT